MPPFHGASNGTHIVKSIKKSYPQRISANGYDFRDPIRISEMDMSSGIQGGVSDMVRDPGDPSFLRYLVYEIDLTGAVQDTENTCLFDLLYIEEQKRFPAQLGWRFWIQVVRSNLDIGLWMQLWVSDSGSRPGDPSFLRP